MAATKAATDWAVAGSAAEGWVAAGWAAAGLGAAGWAAAAAREVADSEAGLVGSAVAGSVAEMAVKARVETAMAEVG